ncbi:MAG: hypothetical protein JST04_08940 [Bdellovibrionales bacterium]|nr:hypothetical protein [Bdellovibrionales bacterium]
MKTTRILALTFLALSSSAAFAHVEPTTCQLDVHAKDPKTGDELKTYTFRGKVKGFPKTTWGLRGHCLAAIGRRPVESAVDVKTMVSGDVLSVRNFTHDNRLFFAAIDLSKLSGSVLQSMHFAPVIGDHAEMRVQFSTSDAIKLYPSLEALKKGATPEFTLNELLLSIEGVPLLGRAYTFGGALKKQLTMAYRMMSVADKLDYVKNQPDQDSGKYLTLQAKLRYPAKFLRRLLVQYVTKSEQLGFSKGYDLVWDNCGNELMHVLQDVSKASTDVLTDAQMISQWNIDKATAPRTIGGTLKDKNLVDMSAELPHFDDEDGTTIQGYDPDFYKKSNANYDARRAKALTGVYVE